MRQQKQVVIDLVQEALGTSFTPFVTVAKDLLTKDQKRNIQQQVFEGIINNEIGYSKDKADIPSIRKYASNVVSNYLRKEKMLNGNIQQDKYSSGTRNDKQLKELNKTLKQFEAGSFEYNKTKELIKTRELELKSQTQSSIGSPPQIDQTVLTPHLKELVRESQGE